MTREKSDPSDHAAIDRRSPDPNTIRNEINHSEARTLVPHMRHLYSNVFWTPDTRRLMHEARSRVYAAIYLFDGIVFLRARLSSP